MSKLTDIGAAVVIATFATGGLYVITKFHDQTTEVGESEYKIIEMKLDGSSERFKAALTQAMKDDFISIEEYDDLIRIDDNDDREKSKNEIFEFIRYYFLTFLR